MSTPPVEEAHQPIEDIRPIVEPESVPVQVPESSTTYYHFEAIRNDGQAIIGSNIYAGGNVNLVTNVWTTADPAKTPTASPRTPSHRALRYFPAVLEDSKSDSGDDSPLDSERTTLASWYSYETLDSQHPEFPFDDELSCTYPYYRADILQEPSTSINPRRQRRAREERSLEPHDSVECSRDTEGGRENVTATVLAHILMKILEESQQPRGPAPAMDIHALVDQSWGIQDDSDSDELAQSSVDALIESKSKPPHEPSQRPTQFPYIIHPYLDDWSSAVCLYPGGMEDFGGAVVQVQAGSAQCPILCVEFPPTQPSKFYSVGASRKRILAWSESDASVPKCTIGLQDPDSRQTSTLAFRFPKMTLSDDGLGRAVQTSKMKQGDVLNYCGIQRYMIAGRDPHILAPDESTTWSDQWCVAWIEEAEIRMMFSCLSHIKFWMEKSKNPQSGQISASERIHPASDIRCELQVGTSTWFQRLDGEEATFEKQEK